MGKKSGGQEGNRGPVQIEAFLWTLLTLFLTCASDWGRGERVI